VIVYIAGPMDAYKDEGYNFEAFHRAAETLRSEGIDVLSPAETAGGVKHLSREFYFRYDFAVLAMVDAIVVLPGWQHSRGAQAEVICATEMGKPVYEYDGVAFDAENPLDITGWTVRYERI